MFQRSSGILLQPTSLPSKFGIGDLGQSAYEFVDFLAKSGQSLWQILPLAPTGYEHSPYTMNFSVFAGNPLLISLEQLAEEGLLKSDELVPLEGSVEKVEFDRVIPYKIKLLRLAFNRFAPTPEFDQFCQQQAAWLDDFALFMALLEANDGKNWNQWDRSIAQRDLQAMRNAQDALKPAIQFQQFLQFKFFQQWMKLREYTNSKNIQLIGDISIYVCFNSVDVWAHPEIFKLDPETFEPTFIAGVPPDYFSATGQLWGNPVYDWDQLQSSQYEWWIQRFQTTLQYVDIVRVDHFRGFQAYWQVPAGEETAINGEWIEAPGADFFETLGQRLGQLPILAEDLGIITPEVEELRDRFNFPGMKILMFAFSDDASNTHLPHHYVHNSVVYPGTHDNDTAIGWWNTISQSEKDRLAAYVGYPIEEIHWTLNRMALASVANWAIVALQDVLGLDGSARMNDPSQNAGNWRWRYRSSELLTDELAEKLRSMTSLYGRI
ncbi:4-alpha-glucanotransferase [Leptolyngbya boryana CZ1]|uniref:4-alpha-glucanotransferase n=1 Tax=Leptolyngbya boryana CZ1 TaxID=3060204 RepID=A0AA96WZS6_LEPBY|nr:4-alpha-glucanotransferase [Leptolyngbya boryana]WNZ48103.1 4-alpha-glucanotransferase [Leptolyngbya boryana CZ1]